MFMQTRISINYRHFNSSLSCRNCLWYLFIKTRVWMYSFMYLHPDNLPACYMPNPQGSTWHEKVYLIAGKSPSQMEMMKVQIFQGTARRVHLIRLGWSRLLLHCWSINLAFLSTLMKITKPEISVSLNGNRTQLTYTYYAYSATM